MQGATVSRSPPRPWPQPGLLTTRLVFGPAVLSCQACRAAGPAVELPCSLLSRCGYDLTDMMVHNLIYACNYQKESLASRAVNFY